MGMNGGRRAVSPGRQRLWVVLVATGLFVGEPAIASQSVQVDQAATVAQLDPFIRGPICHLVESLQATFAQLPALAGFQAAFFPSLFRSFGCSPTTTPGTTTTTSTPGTTTTSTSTPPGSTPTSSVPTTTGPGTTLPPCIPNNPVSTTVPCVPTPPTTAA